MRSHWIIRLFWNLTTFLIDPNMVIFYIKLHPWHWLGIQIKPRAIRFLRTLPHWDLHHLWSVLYCMVGASWKPQLWLFIENHHIGIQTTSNQCCAAQLVPTEHCSCNCLQKIIMLVFEPPAICSMLYSGWYMKAKATRFPRKSPNCDLHHLWSILCYMVGANWKPRLWLLVENHRIGIQTASNQRRAVQLVINESQDYNILKKITTLCYMISTNQMLQLQLLIENHHVGTWTTRINTEI
jgi:hypothetical protein